MKSKKLRADKIYAKLDPIYTMEKTALNYRTPFQLLVATILSAQCTDKQVNKVTPALFKKYKTPQEFLNAPIEDIEEAIRSTGFYRNKAKNIKGCCEGLVNMYGGNIPRTIDEMIKLPGVGRKTANCVLGATYGVPGVVVDTHVKRLAMRMGLTGSDNPDKIEEDIQKIVPEDRWRRFSDILIYHGRAVCSARKPEHNKCAIADLCPSAKE
ncbi:MAG: endonuclease III [Desulfatiglans sp.]|nr:endonuclease III [Desulfatiglans sp.]